MKKLKQEKSSVHTLILFQMELRIVHLNVTFNAVKIRLICSEYFKDMSGIQKSVPNFKTQIWLLNVKERVYNFYTQISHFPQ
jgi:hypothetical protein